MLHLICSPEPMARGGMDLPDPWNRLEERRKNDADGFLWVVPTSRRRRSLHRQVLSQGAVFLPRLHTLESLAAQALEYSDRQSPRVTSPERRLRLARAWFEATASTAGQILVRQLDRFVRDWQACGLAAPPISGPHPGNEEKARDPFARLLVRYLDGLARDRRLDRFGSLVLLKEEIAHPESWPNRLFFQNLHTILFEGFHRLDRVELELISTLSRRNEVFLWLVGVPGTIPFQNLESAMSYLQEIGADPTVHHIAPISPVPLAKLGRKLFSVGRIANPSFANATTHEMPGLFKLEACTPLAEVEEAARRIKADYLQSQTTERPLRLSDIVVIIPGPSYDALVREAFPRAGLEFNLAGRALLVSSSRPARVLSAALDLIQGQWRHDLLLDFLNMPMVKRRLEDSHRLYDLFEHRPRVRQNLDGQLWIASWDRYLERMRSRIRRWATGELDLPEHLAQAAQLAQVGPAGRSKDEFLARQTELADGLGRLIASILPILQPVDRIDRLINQPSPTGTLKELVQAVHDLFSMLEIEKWLVPKAGNQAGAEPVPLVEFEKDQKAFFKLLNILDMLAGLPEEQIPRRESNRLDVRAALEIALEGDSFQIKTEDDAGIQILEIREIRGLQFRHMYVLGLIEGQVPLVPEEGVLASRRRRHPILSQQLEEKEREARYLFQQLFEAAGEKLVLGRTTGVNERPSPFWTEVENLTKLAALLPASLVCHDREMAVRFGRESRIQETGIRSQDSGGNQPGDIWPSVLGSNLDRLREIQGSLSSWFGRANWPYKVQVDAPALLQVAFHEQRPFSPTDLEKYAACPFRYYGSRVLGLSEREPDRTYLEYGQLVHRVFQKFYGQKRREHGNRGPLPPLVRQLDRPRLLEIFQAEWTEMEEGFLSPDQEVLFSRTGGVLDLFFAVMELLEQGQDDLGNLYTEYALQPVEIGKDNQGRRVLLVGKVDRVDVRRQDTGKIMLAVVLDYKTGQVPSPGEHQTKVADGRLLQLPLYGAALQQVDPGVQVIGAAYIHLHRKTKSKNARPYQSIASAGQVFADSRRNRPPFDLQAAVKLALDFAGNIRAGDYSLTAHDATQRFTECTASCPLRHACRHPEGYAVRRW